jgi:hypothetical protein
LFDKLKIQFNYPTKSTCAPEKLFLNTRDGRQQSP